MFDITSCYDSFATEPNTAYFWSVLGNHGAEIAEKIAGENGGVTLEMIMEKNKDSIIAAGFEYNEDLGGFYFTRNNSDDWKAASQAYAEQASGNVHAVLGDNVRENSVWNTKELPALEKNGKVDKVVSVDPSTGKEKDILLDQRTNNECVDFPPSQTNSSTEKVSKGGGSQAPPSNSDTTQVKGALPEQTSNSQTPLKANCHSRTKPLTQTKEIRRSWAVSRVVSVAPPPTKQVKAQCLPTSTCRPPLTAWQSNREL